MDTSFMDFSYFVIMFMVALVAGFINVVSGGGGFLSIGALLISGLPPANALATNKIQALGNSLTSGIYFYAGGISTCRSTSMCFYLPLSVLRWERRLSSSLNRNC